MLLGSRSGLVEEHNVEVFHHYGVNLFSSFLCKISSHFREKNNVVIFIVPFYIFMPLSNLQFVCFQGQFSILRTRSSLNFTRSSTLREERCYLVERESLSQDSFSPLLFQQPTALSTHSRQEMILIQQEYFEGVCTKYIL